MSSSQRTLKGTLWRFYETGLKYDADDIRSHFTGNNLIIRTHLTALTYKKWDKARPTYEQTFKREWEYITDGEKTVQARKYSV